MTRRATDGAGAAAPHGGRRGAGSTRTSFGKMRNLAQILYAALCGSLVAFSAIAFFVIRQFAAPDLRLPKDLLLLAGGALAVTAAGLCAILPGLMARQVAGRDVALRLRALVFGRIVFAAGMEGGGLFFAVLAPILDQPLCLIGPAVACAVLAFNFPTTARLEEALGMSEIQVDAELERLAAESPAGRPARRR